MSVIVFKNPTNFLEIIECSFVYIYDKISVGSIIMYIIPYHTEKFNPLIAGVAYIRVSILY